MSASVSLTLIGHAPLYAHLAAFAAMSHSQRRRAGRDMALEMEAAGYPVRLRKRRYALPGGGHCRLTVFAAKPKPKQDAPVKAD